MLQFLANARDDQPADGGACGACCCQNAIARAGETNKWVISYAQWVAPIGGKGLVSTPTFEIVKANINSAPTGNLPPTNVNYTPTTAFDTVLASTVATSAVDPEAQTLTFALLGLYGPAHGAITFNPDGTYSYTPHTGYSGYDEFYFTTSDAVNAPVVNKVTIRINPAAPAPALPAAPVLPLVHVPLTRVAVRNPLIEFPVIVSPAAIVGDVYRMTIRQAAMDCDLNVYHHVSCYDIAIGKC